MKRPYKHIKLKQNTPEWEQWRYNGIGGSEVASALATDSRELADLVYLTPIQLHLLKIGEPVTKFSGNESSEEGHYQEQAIIDRFSYYDLENPEQMNIYRNMKAGHKVNGIYRPKDVLQNDKYPWLFLSEDAFMTESVKSKKPKALIETKLTTSMEANRYTDKVNPSHFLQLQTGLLITGFEVGYLITLTDGKWFSVTTVRADKEIHQWIAEVTASFWLNVAKARKIKIEHNLPSYFNVIPDTLTEHQREGALMLAELEPKLTGSDKEVTFLRDMVIPSIDKIEREGTQEEFELCVQYKSACDSIDTGQNKKNEAYGRLLLSLSGATHVKFDDGKRGYYSFQSDKHGKKSMRVSLK
jgi:hypothetical protein